MADILTIVVTFNGMKWIGRCLGSVRASAVPSDIMVVDNGSDDGTPEWVQENFPEAILTRNRENLGFGAANNLGIRFALDHDYRYVYLLNQDAWVFPETFGTLLRAFDDADAKKAEKDDASGKDVEKDDAGGKDVEKGASGKKAEKGREAETGGRPVGIVSPMQMQANLMRMDAQFEKHCGAALGKAQAETARVPFVMAAHWMVSRRCLETVGAFSPLFPHYGEDVDYIHRAAFHGFDAAVAKTASAVHDRADRPRPKEYRMKLKVITAKAAVADPRTNPQLTLIGQCIVLALQSILHFSAIPWKGIGELRASFSEIKRCRRQAQQPAAFLEANGLLVK